MSKGDFFLLTPDRVLGALEAAGFRTTGLCYALNSLENRVYEVGLTDDSRVVAKFYRPLRWSRETILDEHRLLQALEQAEIPVCPARALANSATTLGTTPEGIHFAVFSHGRGRSPADLLPDDLRQIGHLLARIHNVASDLSLLHRPEITPTRYGKHALAVIERHAAMPAGTHRRFVDLAQRVTEYGEKLYQRVQLTLTHGDCHRGNLLRQRETFCFLDFDDCARAPAVQDFWMLLPGRPEDSQAELAALLEGYREVREFDARELELVELLRALRYLHFAAWIAERWEDPSFPRAFPQFGTESYWEGQAADLSEQLDRLAATAWRWN